MTAQQRGQFCRTAILVIVTGALIPAIVSAQPVIVSIVPDNAAAGIGQTITIQGGQLTPQGVLPTVTFTHRNTGLACDDVLIFPTTTLSTGREVYVRLFQPGGWCDLGPGQYEVVVTNVMGTSNAFGFRIRPKPAAPIPRAVFLPGHPACSVSPGGEWDICVQAYGTDFQGISPMGARFNQANVIFLPEQPVVGTSISTAFGLVHRLKLPSEFVIPGGGWVQLRTTVAGVPSDLSFALAFSIR